ncbi:NADPH-dependent FMN reductase [Enterococcus xiangfangensis]|uniref:NAD(P)H-dependent oxidoreductase n=1 Tax=Enterococcus xiangfangensis TaxID=1296537 RepID=A0ABU3FAT9_9ENTE|nr:NADPH-dependent FMN reductase [Enterococcus xiangfangensis]MBM7711107.1 NAD(P)H-dependent FMN reductase [Enterococcus xiangfangensis]MDT2759172.1 NAD(P)H-dependent oxidoreductase [Enterococcus xiangfangensis]
MKNLLAIVGTNSTESTNRNLLKYMKNHFVDQASIEVVEIGDLPMFNKPEDTTLPPEVLALAKKVEASEGVIISTPEYDHAVPASLINALNWLSYHIFPFVDKPVMVLGASYGTLGSSRAQAHLRQILDSPELKARVMPSSEYLLAHSLQAFDDEGNLKNADDIKQLDGLFKDFLIFVEISNQMNAAHEQNKKEAANFSWEAN